MPRHAVVTDSTAMLPPELAQRHGISVVPLQVIIGSEARLEGEPGATPESVAAALRDHVRVTTSRAVPGTLLATYEELAADGASGILSIHLSSEISGTVDSARLAAAEASVPVTVVDTRQVGVGTGFAALAAADVLADGRTLAEAAAVSERRAAATTSLFYVDTLEYLRRGGRVGAAAAFFGGALAVKPLLHICEGKVASRERLRTSSRALARLEDLAVAAAEEQPVEVCVAHLASPERAAELTDRLTDRLSEQLAGREVWCGEVGAVLGAHVGPGMVAVCVAPVVDDDS